MEKASAESGSSGGFGSCTVMFASIDVRPLYRCGSRAILPKALRAGATRGIEANAGISAAMAVVRSSKLCHFGSIAMPAAIAPSRSHLQLSSTSELGLKTWKNRWARPSLLISVPSDSANVPAGSTTAAASVVDDSMQSSTTTWRARRSRAVISRAGARRNKSFSRTIRVLEGLL